MATPRLPPEPASLVKPGTIRGNKDVVRTACGAGDKRARSAGGLVLDRPEFVARIRVDLLLKVVPKSSSWVMRGNGAAP